MNTEPHPEQEPEPAKSSLKSEDARDNRPQGVYGRPSVLLDQETCNTIDWKAYYGF